MGDSQSENSQEPKSDKCPECGFLLPLCQCGEAQADLHGELYRPVLSVETTGKRDYVYTVIEKLPKSELFLRTLLKKLLKECDSKGSYRIEPRYGLIEIHGDKRILIRAFFDQQKISYIG